MSNSREPGSLEALVRELGPNVWAATVEAAADFGEVVLVAIPFKDYKTLPADQLSGKVVVDVMNYYPQRDGQIDFGDLASSEPLALHLPRTRLVKAFNVMHYETLATPRAGQPRHTTRSASCSLARATMTRQRLSSAG
ncbi:MAG TPA: NAD(P)-binding domain-containing protein [Rubrobacteraceae bacterium]|nr:NAD(P)-binding domain-containing protein [Rubrobacteraceae bacterium]